MPQKVLRGKCEAVSNVSRVSGVLAPKHLKYKMFLAPKHLKYKMFLAPKHNKT